MVISPHAYLALLAGLATERLYELWLSKRHARRMLSRGAIEVGRGHYYAMIGFHTCFILACGAEGTFSKSYFPHWLSILGLTGAAMAQALRYWSVTTLGENWNTRVIVVPNQPPITSGPYRYIRHPNYTAVMIEIACVPLIRGAVITAVGFSALNVLLLHRRIQLEEDSLGENYRQTFSERPRFLPHLLR